MTLASIHAGLFDGLPSLTTCSHDPILNKMWGVDRPATIEAPSGSFERGILKFKSGDLTYEIFRHPLLFLSEDVYAFYDCYDIITNYGKLDTQNASCVFLDAIRTYKFYLRKFEQVKK